MRAILLERKNNTIKNEYNVFIFKCYILVLVIDY